MKHSIEEQGNLKKNLFINFQNSLFTIHIQIKLIITKPYQNLWIHILNIY